MASIYLRPDSPYIWIRYKKPNGKWANGNTGYKNGNPGERRQAQLLAREKTLEELSARIPADGRTEFDEWVIPWIDQKWGHLQTITPKYYRRFYLWWAQYLKEVGVTSPVAVTREIVLGYLSWRKEHGGGRNTAIYETKFFGQIMDEAVQRGFARTNPARTLGLKKEEQEHKTPWTDEEVQRVGRALGSADKFGWMHVTFLMGLFQASRLRQCAEPLRLIDLNRQLINYADADVKGRKGFSQPIDPDFLPILRSIVELRIKLGHKTLCDIPPMPSIQWRKFLDKLDLGHLCHHGLRASLITRYAVAGVPEAMTRRFVNHAGKQIHELYQRITAVDLAPMFGMVRQPQIAADISLPEPKD